MAKLRLSGSVIDAQPVSFPATEIDSAPVMPLPVMEPEILTRRAILVHAGSFICSDGSEITFTRDRIRRIVQVNNAALLRLAGDYGGLDRMPTGAHRPMLDMHDDASSNDKIVGRLPNLLHYEELDIPGVGKMVPAVITVVHFLGRETCKRVLDGRIYHLSVGIDEETDLLDEVSTVIVPAAPGAMLLSRGKKLSKEERSRKMAKAKSRLKKLAALQKSITKVSTQIGVQKKSLQLAANQQKVLTRLSGLVSSRRMTPAEWKKQDVKKLSAMSGESLDAYLSAFDTRESVIDDGQRGSTTAVEFSQMAREMGDQKMTALRAETLGDFASRGVKLKSGAPTTTKKKLSGALEEKSKALSAETAQIGGESREQEAGAALDSARQLSHAGLEGGEDVGKQLAAMQEQIDSLQTVLATVVDEIKDLITADQAEEQELEAGQEPGAEEGAELSEGEKPGEEKDKAEMAGTPGEKPGEGAEESEKPGEGKQMSEGDKGSDGKGDEADKKNMSEGEDKASKSEAKPQGETDKEKESK